MKLEVSRIRFLAGAVGVLILLSSFLGCKPQATATLRDAPPMVIAATVSNAASTALVLPALVAPATRFRLGFRASGVLSRVAKDAGAQVKRGELLAELDSTSAASQLRAAKAQQQAAGRNAQRIFLLASQGALPRTTEEQAQVELEAANSGLAIAVDAINANRLVAPASGVLFQRLAHEGEAVLAGQPIVILDDTENLIFVTSTSAGDVARVRIGQRVHLSSELYAANFDTRVESVAAAPDQATGMYDVKLRGAEASVPKLRPGLVLTAHFDEASGARETSIPASAVVRRGENDFVYVIADDGKLFRLNERRVVVDTLGDRDQIYVRSGLNPDERVVAEGGRFLTNGLIVRVDETRPL